MVITASIVGSPSDGFRVKLVFEDSSEWLSDPCELLEDALGALKDAAALAGIPVMRLQ